MKILMIDNSKGWGGAEELLLSLSMSLRERGHSVGLLLREGAKTVDKFQKAGFPVWTYPRKGMASLFAVVRIVSVLRNEKFDLIHVHRHHDIPVAFFHRFFARRIPIMLTQHTHLGEKDYFAVAAASRIIAISEFIARGILKNHSTIKKKLAVIHNGITICEEHYSDSNYWDKFQQLSRRRPLLGVIGYLYKNQEEIVELMPEIRRVFPAVALIIIGNDDYLKKPLEEKIRALGLDDAVFFAGWIPHEEMHEALASLDLNVSVYKKEPFGLHVIEGMAAGTPLVAYRAGGFPEVVEHEVSGYLAETQEELLKVVICLLKDREKLNQMAQNARKRAVERFSLDLMVSRYEKAYEM